MIKPTTTLEPAGEDIWTKSAPDVGELCGWIESELKFVQGSEDIVGSPFRLQAWQRDFLAQVFEPGVRTAVLSMGRGGGKSSLLACIAAAALVGPIRRPLGDIIIAAASVQQAFLILRHVKAHVRGRAGVIRLTERQIVVSGDVRCRVISSDPARALGLQPTLVLADEVGAWPTNVCEKMVAALRTSLGKLPHAKMIAISTRPSSVDHIFNRMIAGESDAVACYSVESKDAELDDPANWIKANPGLPEMPLLHRHVAAEAVLAKKSKVAEYAFRNLHLNTPSRANVDALVVEASDWRAIEHDPADLPPREGVFVLGLDMGGTSSMTAAAGIWETGRLESIAAFPSEPSFEVRGRDDAVGDLYERLGLAGELVALGELTVPPEDFLQLIRNMWGMPDWVVADRFRKSDVLQGLRRAGYSAQVEWRGTGYLHATEDVSAFRRSVLEKRFAAERGRVLLPASLAHSRLILGPNSTTKLATANAAGRVSTSRTDPTSAAVLAAGLLTRILADRESAESEGVTWLF